MEAIENALITTTNATKEKTTTTNLPLATGSISKTETRTIAIIEKLTTTNIPLTPSTIKPNNGCKKH